ncbi:embryo-specific protein 3 [Rhynchospora pubera]|uniref:Embryo-specific protein 3 n=1 Tax=Rhynchospora pubera TaxID=906938 RepID=A0AAV8FNB5_9POAL|nr:embryo-specific protein 3 [Rhynchospora pubera]
MANLLTSTFSLLLLFSFVLSSVADADLSLPTTPQELRSFKIHDTQVGEKASGCSYTVKIKTSCSSPRYTRDAISIAFGDRYRNEVYAPRIDDPSSDTFESCSTDTFTLQGPCGYGVCYLYLYRSGYDGWVPSSVKIYEPSGRAVTFYYDTPIPNGVWYGFDQCRQATLASI